MIEWLVMGGVALWAMSRRGTVSPTPTPTGKVTTQRITSTVTPTTTQARPTISAKGRSDAEILVGQIKFATQAGAQGLKGLQLLGEWLLEAGYSESAVVSMLDVGAEIGGDAAFAAVGGSGTNIVSQAGIDIATTTGQQLVDALGSALSYLPYVMAVISIVQIAVSNKQDDQKAVGAAGVVVTLAVTIMIPFAIAAPVAMGLGFIVSHIMEEMEDIPHEVREILDVVRRTGDVQQYYIELDRAPNWGALKSVMDKWAQETATTVDRMRFVVRWGKRSVTVLPGEENAATKAQVFSNPMLLKVIPQLGVSDTYKAPWRDFLSEWIRNRVMIFALEAAGDPHAKMVAFFLRKRIKALNTRDRLRREAKIRAETAIRSVRTIEEAAAIASREGFQLQDMDYVALQHLDAGVG